MREGLFPTTSALSGVDVVPVPHLAPIAYIIAQGKSPLWHGQEIVCQLMSPDTSEDIHRAWIPLVVLQGCQNKSNILLISMDMP